MKILYSPCVWDGSNKIIYGFDNQKITATYKGIVDEFDFTDLPDGKVEEIETELEMNPIIEATKENGVLSVVLLNFIEERASEEERFPVWLDTDAVEEVKDIEGEINGEDELEK